MIEAINKHFRNLEGLAQEYGIEKDWIAEYRGAARVQMEKDFQALRPFYHSATPSPLAKSWNEMIRSVYDTLLFEFSKVGVRRGQNELALQLTSIICSPSEVFDPGTSITPKAVGKVIERNKRRKKLVRKIR